MQKSGGEIFGKTCFHLEEHCAVELTTGFPLPQRRLYQIKMLIYRWQACLWCVDKKAAPALFSSIQPYLVSICYSAAQFFKRRQSEFWLFMNMWN